MQLSFAPGEAAQVDFGSGPVLAHPDGKSVSDATFPLTATDDPIAGVTKSVTRGKAS